MKKKFNYLLLILIIILGYSNICYSQWIFDQTKQCYYWILRDNTFPSNQWVLIDDDGDGIGCYYYFDEKSKLLVDTIAPDYSIVNANGQKLDLTGQIIRMPLVEEDVILKDSIDVKSNNVSEELINNNAGVKSVGTLIGGEKDDSSVGPHIGIVEDNQQEAKQLLDVGVVLKKDTDYYDNSIDNNASLYISGGNNYGKNVTGTIYTKSKWKGVMSLKGSGAYIDIDNPNNNFNKLTGRIATHNFSYTDRETMCTLIIYDDKEEEYYSTSDFNYNGGVRFEVYFPKKTKKIRLELSVTGTYTSRIAYIRDLKYGFDKETYFEELDQDIEDSYYESLEAENAYLVGSDEGISDEEISDEEMSEEKRKELESKASAEDAVAGPNFDRKLKNKLQEWEFGPGVESKIVEKEDVETPSEAKRSSPSNAEKATLSEATKATSSEIKKATVSNVGKS